MRKKLLLSKNVKCIQSKNCRLEFSQTLIACLSFACIVNTSIYRACYSEVVWQNVRVKDLFEVACGVVVREEKTSLCIRCNPKLCIDLSPNFCIERELCICMREQFGCIGIWALWLVRVLLHHFVFSTFISENIFCRCPWI